LEKEIEQEVVSKFGEKISNPSSTIFGAEWREVDGSEKILGNQNEAISHNNKNYPHQSI
jgi:hypothetical protein